MCLRDLRIQLYYAEELRNRIELEEALNCWKVVAVLKNTDLKGCRETLEMYYDRFLSGTKFYGKFGGSKTPGTEAIILYVDSEEESRSESEAMKDWMEKVPEIETVEVDYSRGCENIHGLLFGDWRDWKEKNLIKEPLNDPQNRGEFLTRLNNILKG